MKNSKKHFITICSKNKENIFGKCKDVVGGAACLHPVKVKLSKIGKIINKQWNNIGTTYDGVELDQYVIMPNHIHGIVIIHDQNTTINKIIRSFKSKSTMEYLKYIKRNNMNISVKIWQQSFHDHIIRNERSLDRIRQYISTNPATWAEDEENPDRITERCG